MCTVAAAKGELVRSNRFYAASCNDGFDLPVSNVCVF